MAAAFYHPAVIHYYYLVTVAYCRKPVSNNYAGENIAMGYSSPEAVMTAWMNSAGHRANILSANFTTLGVGYVADGGYWTQWFIG